MKFLWIVILLANFSAFADDSVDTHNAIDGHNKAMKKLKSGMKVKAKEAKNCNTIIKRLCGKNETKSCAKSIAYKLPAHCKKMITSFDETSQSISGGMSSCTKVATKKCVLPDDIDENPGALASYQNCLEKAMKADSKCIKTLKDKVKNLDSDNSEGSDVYKEFVR